MKVFKLIDRTLLKFVVVGVINTLFGSAVMFAVYNLLGCSYWVSSAANYIFGSEYYGAAEPPVRCGESHLSGLTEPPHFVY